MFSLDIPLKNITSRCFLLTLFLLAGCYSLPKPADEHREVANKLISEAKSQADKGQTDLAITNLKSAREKVTDGGKLKNGQGGYFLNEAYIAALTGHIEFERNNLLEATNLWKESFDIEYNGAREQQFLDIKNAKIRDVIVNALSEGFASAGASRSRGGSYTYFTQTTVLPTPEMMQKGLPSGTVLRFPIRVERPPFSNIVKFKSDKSSCTASMVSPKIGITAAHCMSLTGAPVRPSNMTVQRNGIFESKEMKIIRYYTHKGQNSGWDTQRANDWLIFETDIPSEGSSNFSKVLAKIPPEVSSGKEKLMLAGYSADLNTGSYLTLHYGCNIKKGQDFKSGIYYTNCENAKGSSGAPVMMTTPPYGIIGIHTAQIVKPTDEFYSVETFSDDFVNTLSKVMSGDKILPSQTTNPSSKSKSFGRYISIDKNSSEERYLDTKKLSGNKDSVEVTVITNYLESKSLNGATFKSESNLIELDCKYPRFTPLNQSKHSEYFGVGTIVESQDYVALGTSKRQIIPFPSYLFEVRRIACEKVNN